jgi:hypothetical protein
MMNIVFLFYSAFHNWTLLIRNMTCLVKYHLLDLIPVKVAQGRHVHKTERVDATQWHKARWIYAETRYPDAISRCTDSYEDLSQFYSVPLAERPNILMYRQLSRHASGRSQFISRPDCCICLVVCGSPVSPRICCDTSLKWISMLCSTLTASNHSKSSSFQTYVT